MKYGICLLSLIPQRAEPSEKSEMVNQLLFGDVFTVTGKHENWLKVTANYDGYQEWIDEKMTSQSDGPETQNGLTEGPKTQKTTVMCS